MIPRKRLDIGWSDFWFGLRGCLGSESPAIQRRLESQWSPPAASLACLSVRSGFDALLSVLNFPPGSEILVSAVTIRDMARIIAAHGLVAVPIDLDMRRLEIRGDLLAAAVTPRTKAILVAHLFGSRMPLAEVVEAARRRQLLVIEDCAQAYAGDAFRGNDSSDVTMFSFGAIKTATALGGAILKFRDGELCERVRVCQSQWPLQSPRHYAARLAKLSLLHLLSCRSLYTVLTGLCRVAGVSHDAIVSSSVRGFTGGEFFRKIRRRPCTALLALLARRIATFDARSITRRIALAERLAAQLPQVERPGVLAEVHTHWVFPILTSAPDELVRHLCLRGFDATRGNSSLAVVPPPADRPEIKAIAAEAAMARLVYLPVDSAMSERDIDLLAAAANEFAASAAATIGPAPAAIAVNR